MLLLLPVLLFFFKKTSLKKDIRPCFIECKLFTTYIGGKGTIVIILKSYCPVFPEKQSVWVLCSGKALLKSISNTIEESHRSYRENVFNFN